MLDPSPLFKFQGLGLYNRSAKLLKSNFEFEARTDSENLNSTKLQTMTSSKTPKNIRRINSRIELKSIIEEGSKHEELRPSNKEIIRRLVKQFIKS